MKFCENFHTKKNRIVHCPQSVMFWQDAVVFVAHALLYTFRTCSPGSSHIPEGKSKQYGLLGVLDKLLLKWSLGFAYDVFYTNNQNTVFETTSFLLVYFWRLSSLSQPQNPLKQRISIKKITQWPKCCFDSTYIFLIYYSHISPKLISRYTQYFVPRKHDSALIWEFWLGLDHEDFIGPLDVKGNINTHISVTRGLAET